MLELFHGSYAKIDVPRIIVSNRMLDYGTGFYTTTDKNQAIRFTEKFIPLGKPRVVNVYEFDEKAQSHLSTKTFATADHEWLEYVVANRLGKGLERDYDVVIGPVANDRVYSVVELFESGDYSADEALRRLKTYRLVDQVTLKSEAALAGLRFKFAFAVDEVEDDRG
jgi:hypothetical protein